MSTRRSNQVKMSPEAQVLRTLRKKHGYSMRSAGKELGYSDSYISQIENGRENIPTGKKLKKFLTLYGGISEKYFKQLCSEWKKNETDDEAILKLLPKLTSEQLKLIRHMVEKMLEKELEN